MRESSFTVIAGCFGVVGLMVALMTVQAILNGVVLSMLWKWFIVSWFGMKPLSIPVAIGICLIMAYTTYNHRSEPKEKESHILSGLIAQMIARPVVALGIGWFATLFM